MNKNRKLGWKLQLFAQTWSPDKVTVFEHKDGTIPEKYQNMILKEVMENSKVMQLAKYEEMDSKEKKFEYFAKGPGAYWVGEGEKIKTSKAQWLQVKMVAKKLGVIIPCSREFLHYKMSDFFEVMKPKIAEAFYKKFDAAAILDVENPFLHAVEKSVKASGNVIDGVLNYDNILEMEDLLTDEDYDVNAFISTKKNRSTLRNTHRIENGVIVESLYDRSANTLDGQPVADLKALDKGTIYAGDFDYMYYGIPYGMSYKISEEAQLSTLTNEDGTPVNLYEQELVALRVTMDVGFMIVKDEAFAKLTSGGLGKLTVTSTAGTKAGDTKIAVTPALTSGNSYKYKVGDEMDVPVKGQNVKGWKTWDGAADITPGEGSEIVVAECDASYRVVNAGKTDVTVKE
ncbi:phage major capsid protein [Sporofaciens sp. JLR.KK001]|uniref:phage major capsid protein n=1 Tax=Sporofaciens sp. JLR.KK001 TaxID=3112621 RepID=UPI002FF43262